MTFVHGKANVEYLRKRYEALQDQPLFAGMEYTEDLDTHRRVDPAHAKKRNPKRASPRPAPRRAPTSTSAP